MLVSLFGKFNDKDSDNSSPGVPYVTEPETVALAKYDRETVAKTYEKIEKDLIESIDILGSAAIYTLPRIHIPGLLQMLMLRVFIFTKEIGEK